MYQLLWKGFSHSWKARSNSIAGKFSEIVIRGLCSQEQPFLDAGLLPLFTVPLILW